MTTQVQYSRLGGPEVLEVVDVPTPTAPSNGVLVRVRAAGVNPIDWKLRRGIRASEALDKPRVPGFDGAGDIVEVGADVRHWQVGDAVILHDLPGTYATEVIATAGNLVRKPESVSYAEGAALGIPVGTAYQSLKSLGVGEDTVLLIHGASGSVGQAAIQLAKLWGATVIGTASAANQARLRELGAIPVTYGEGLLERIRAVAPGGVDRVLDAAGTDEALTVSLQLVRDPQHVATIVAGAKADDLGIQAYGGGSRKPMTEEQLRYRREAVGYVARLMDQGEFQVEVARTYPLAEAAEAQRESESGHVRGKIVLIP